MKPTQQSGMALLMVLMIFAMVSIVATGIIQSQSADIQRITNRLGTQQARAFADGAESVVRTGLYLDWDNDPDIDHYLEEWTVERTFPMELGTVFVRISDLQGRFNLNWLHPKAANRTVWWQRLRNLLKRLEVDPIVANYVSDWMDETSQADDTYLSQDPPYRAAYRICKHTSELMLIEGVTTEIYQQLLPYVTCLPMDTQLNINTASASVLSALDSRMTVSEAEQVISARDKNGIAAVADFLALDAVSTYAKPPSSNNTAANNGNQQSTKKPWDANDFSVRSEYFEGFTRVEMGDSGDWVATNEFLLKRDVATGYIDTWYRDFSRREARPLPQN
jgi:general secretion pathway protein K